LALESSVPTLHIEGIPHHGAVKEINKCKKIRKYQTESFSFLELENQGMEIDTHVSHFFFGHFFIPCRNELEPG
jgi:hypothetical protein